MKQLLFVLFALLIKPLAWSQTSENVITHQKVIINTDPSKGIKSFIQWGTFPAPDKSVRKVVMNLTLAYPEDRPIAHWDYMDRVLIRRQGGIKGKELNYEIGRMLTPYGSNFKEGWSYTWQVDVTDFQSLLRDSVEIEYIHSGYESPELGWDLTIDFDIHFGPVVAELKEVQKLWTGGFQYGNPENNIENYLKPIKIKTVSGAQFGRFRIQHTGHGMDQPNGCSEFCSRWRELLLDDQVIDHRDMWKECGDNPLYPQGGTWIFDRAYWCPGDLQIPDIIDMPLTEKKHTLDLNMQPFTANNIEQPKEQISSFFFQYGAPAHANDVTIEEIIAPNKAANYNRFNPTGVNPIIKIRNLGSETLRHLIITYYTGGFEAKTYEWTGQLDFYQAALIAIPGDIDAKAGINTFNVNLSNPNGKSDEWEEDNALSCEFEDIPTLPTHIVVDFMTNMQPEENTLCIVNSRNDTLLHKKPTDLKPDTTYLDTLYLPQDKYFLHLSDTAGTGLEFWFLSKAGFGRLRLKDTTNHLIKLFESDFGNSIYYAFKTNETFMVDTTQAHLSVNIYPRMVEDYATIYTTTNKASTLKIRITKDGEYIETHEFTNIIDAQTGLDLRHLENGRYVAEIYIDGEHQMNRRFNKVSKERKRN
jgi:hypothetical protein